MQFYMVRATLIRFILYWDNNRKLLGWTDKRLNLPERLKRSISIWTVRFWITGIRGMKKGKKNFWKHGHWCPADYNHILILYLCRRILKNRSVNGFIMWLAIHYWIIPFVMPDYYAWKVIPREKGITGKYRNCFRRILQLMNSGNTASFSGMVYNCWEKEKKLKQVNRWIS